MMVLLFLPLTQQLTGWVKVKVLHGAVAEVEKPKLTFDSYKDLSYQSQLENYAAAHFGFREPVIRIYNQYLWSCFRKTYAAEVVVGRDKWLYGKKSLNDYCHRVAYEYAEDNEALVQKFEKELALLKKVQLLLDKHGTKLFVLICPNKDDVYPEHHPKHGVARGDGMRAIDYYPKAFEENGINFLDVHTWFQQIKDTVSYPLFTHSGMHWSNIACAYASDSIFRYMEQLTGKNMPNISYGSKYQADPIYPDRDLEQTMNLLWKIKPLDYYYVHIDVVPDSTAQKLNLITIGDSFFWNMYYSLPMDKFFETYRYWYYFSSVFFDPNHNHVSQINLIEELNRADVVMISLCTTQLYEINHGFLSQALIQLSSNNPDNMEEILNYIKHKMKTNSTWFESLKQKAEKQGKTLEQVMDADARYVFNQNPGKYMMNTTVERIKNAMRDNPVWFEDLQQKALKKGKDLEQLMNDEAIYLINQNPERYLK